MVDAVCERDRAAILQVRELPKVISDNCVAHVCMYVVHL